MMRMHVQGPTAVLTLLRTQDAATLVVQDIYLVQLTKSASRQSMTLMCTLLKLPQNRPSCPMWHLGIADLVSEINLPKKCAALKYKPMLYAEYVHQLAVTKSGANTKLDARLPHQQVQLYNAAYHHPGCQLH